MTSSQLSTHRKAIYSALLIMLLSACSSIHKPDIDITTIANRSGFIKQVYTFQDFPITSLQHLKNTSTPFITIYIEGDGYAYITKSRPSSNPTPKTPVALRLAQNDQNVNVVYLGRPCHYASQQDLKEKCDRRYWTTHRFAKNVVQAYHTILDGFKTKNPDTRFNLIGFSGGANIAGLLAASRDDVESLRTVAGNIDNDFFTQFHKVSNMPHSLNMANHAHTLGTTPQWHFIAEKDRFVPVDIYQSYQSKLPVKSCTHMHIVENTTHLNGWAEKWPALLKHKPACQ